MPESSFQLDHLNLPARDPEGLARWYAATLGLRADQHRVRGPGVLLVFAKGEPVDRAPEFHLGMRVPSMRVLSEWAEKFEASVKAGPEFSSFQISDPEGNCIELYTPSNPA
jgi:catechol-2,3-dioxygenase